MIATIDGLRVDLKQPFALGQVLRPVISLDDGGAPPTSAPPQPNAFYAPAFRAEPVRMGTFVGATALGGPVNFFDLHLNPHGNGTHTECVGHIAREPYLLSDCLRNHCAWAWLLRLQPELRPAPAGMSGGPDQVLTRAELQTQLAALQRRAGAPDAAPCTALVIGSAPEAERRNRIWTGQNPPYVEAEALAWLADEGYEHVLVDLPSVDREQDGGALAAHRAWWRYPAQPRTQATITELIVVPDAAPEGRYWLHFQVASMALDAAPDNPVLYPVIRP
jgi:arylformamidase